MDLDRQEIGANVIAQLEKLYEQRSKLEAQIRDKLNAVNAEIATLERIAGLRKRPGRQKSDEEMTEEKASTKKSSPLIGIAEAVLESHEGEAFSSSQIAQLAVDTGLWTDPPKSFKANMARVLKSDLSGSRIYAEETADGVLQFSFNETASTDEDFD